MYVCVCNAVTERDIEKAVRRGARSLAELRLATGCSSNCGQCADLAETLIDEQLERQSLLPVLGAEPQLA